MPILVDTNVLLCLAQPNNPMYKSAANAIAVLLERQEDVVVALQNVAEFWNVATRPADKNGLGFSIEEAQTEIAQLYGCEAQADIGVLPLELPIYQNHSTEVTDTFVLHKQAFTE